MIFANTLICSSATENSCPSCASAFSSVMSACVKERSLGPGASVSNGDAAISSVVPASEIGDLSVFTLEVKRGDASKELPASQQSRRTRTFAGLRSSCDCREDHRSPGIGLYGFLLLLHVRGLNPLRYYDLHKVDRLTHKQTKSYSHT